MPANGTFAARSSRGDFGTSRFEGSQIVKKLVYFVPLKKGA